MGRFSHFQFLTFFNRYMFKVIDLYTFRSEIIHVSPKIRFCIAVPCNLTSQF